VLHGQVGEVIEQLYADRLPEQYEILAYHFERAEQWRKAFDYLVLSARKALAALAVDEGFGFLDRALGAVAHDPSLGTEALIDVHLLRAMALDFRSDAEPAEAAFRAAIEAAQASGAKAREGQVHAALAVALVWGHRFEEAMAEAARAREIAAEMHDDSVLAESLVTDAMVTMVTGDIDAGRAALDAIPEARRDDPGIVGYSLLLYGIADLWQGHADRSLQPLRRAAESAIQGNNMTLAVEPAWTYGLALVHVGRYDEALEALRGSLALSEGAGERRIRSRILNSLGWIYLDLCDWERAREQNELAVIDARDFGEPEMIRNSELNLADTFLATGRLDEAIELLEGVERACGTPGTWGGEWMQWRYSQHLSASLGEARLRQGKLDLAREYGQRCVVAAERYETPRNIVKGRRLLAQVALEAGDAEEAVTQIEAALPIAREVGNPIQLWKTLAVAAEAYEASARRDDADAVRQETSLVIDAVAAGLRDPDMRTTFLASAHA